jgi:hypothetical protein
MVVAQTKLKGNINKKPPRKIHMFNKGNIDGFKKDLKSYQEEYLQSHKTRSVNDNWSDIKLELHKLMDMYIPTKTISGRFHQPWITKNIKRAVNKKQRIYKKARKTNSDEDWGKFKEFRKATKKLIQKSHNEFLNNMLDPESDTNSKKLWSYIKSKRQDTTGIGSLYHQGQTIDDSRGKATALNSYFQSVFTQEDTANIPDKGPSIHPQMNSINIDPAGVEKLLLNLKPDKASGPDNITARLLKTMAHELAPILAALYQQSLDTGSIPIEWLNANVTPIHKKGKRTDPQNYRPVSLTSIACKTLEHIIVSNLMKFLDVNNILLENQHGFRHNRSCETQLFMAIHDIAEALNSHLQTDIVILDFSKAFDKVPHERLLHKLKYYGIEGNLCSWIRTFLTNRQQRVVLDGTPSSYLPVHSGVPQGTVLGPVLFLLFINDIADNIKSNIRLFADDCLLYRTITNENDHQMLQADLDRLISWSDTWQMSFNASKCFVMQTTLVKKQPTESYSINNTILAKVESNPYLGVHLHNKLSATKHVDTITNKANRVLGFLRRNLKQCPKEVKEKAYHAMVQPHLEYASSVWDPHTKENKAKINMVQRRGARFVLNRYRRRDSPTQMLGELGWPTPERKRTEARLILLYKIVFQLVAIPVTYLPPLAQTRTRHSHSLKYQRYQTNVMAYQYSLLPRTVPTWNLLPESTVTAASLDLFKRGLASAKF